MLLVHSSGTLAARPRCWAAAARLTLALWLCAGCAVGPDYHPLTSFVPEAWRGADIAKSDRGSRVVDTPVDPARWWANFQDPILNDLVSRALQTNLDLRLAEARIRQARAARAIGAAALGPTIDGSAAYNRGGSGDSAGRSGARSVAGVTSAGAGDWFQAGLDAAWELDWFGGKRRNLEALDADLQAAVEDRRAVLVSLAAEIGLNYFTLRGLQQQIISTRNNLHAQQRTAELTRQRFEAGFVSALDVANASAQAASTAARIPVLESGVREAIHVLSGLLGDEPNALLNELERTAPIAPVPPEVPVGLPSDLLRRRPDIRRAEARIHAATARIGVATADLFPKFALTGSLGFSGDTLSSAAAWSSRVWSAGPGVQWRIFDAGQIRWNIEVQKALEEQSLLTYQQTVLTALREVETALVAFAKEQEHHLLLTEAVVQNRRAVQLAKTLYTAGQTDFLSVLAAQGALFTSEDTLVQSTRALSVNLVALYKALGGGWEG